MTKRTYGTIEYEKKTWLIKCEPHVKTRLKRVFPQVKQYASECIEISDNPSNCHDLLWFIDRYPMTVDQLTYLKEQSTAYENLQQDILEIMEYKRPLKEFKLAEPPWEYQKAAADLLYSVKGLLLTDEVGLGKTVSAICLMVEPESLPVMVVTLTHLPSQIQAAINRFAPGLKTHILKKGTPYPLSKNPDQVPDVIICNYAKLNGWAEYLTGKINYIVFDEIQELRTGPGSNKYQGAKVICDKAVFKLGLSGTPIYNYGDEFFNVVDILRPGALGSKEEFSREWCTTDKKITDPKAFGTFLRDQGIMLRRTRKDVGKELPDVQVIPQYIESDPKILESIKGKAIELAKIILNSTQDFKGQKFEASKEFSMMMRQATGIAKAAYVAEFVRMLVESGESVLLFGWHRAVYNIWMERLAEFNPLLYTGTESPKQKDKAKEAFLEGQSKVLIISLRSGAGLDGLQFHPNCSSIVFGELDWSPGVHEQCVGRLKREGQTKKLAAFYLLADSGSDPIISDVLGIKKGQLDGVNNPNGDLFEELVIDNDGVKRLAAEVLSRNNQILECA